MSAGYGEKRTVTLFQSILMGIVIAIVVGVVVGVVVSHNYEANGNATVDNTSAPATQVETKTVATRQCGLGG